MNTGYLGVSLYANDGKRKIYLYHRILAIVYIPNDRLGIAKTIDHINRDKVDNRICNLRWATNSEQQLNKSVASNNKLGEPNVFYHPRDKHYIVKKTILGKTAHNYFKDAPSAIKFAKRLNTSLNKLGIAARPLSAH